MKKIIFMAASLLLLSGSAAYAQPDDYTGYATLNDALKAFASHNTYSCGEEGLKADMIDALAEAGGFNI